MIIPRKSSTTMESPFTTLTRNIGIDLITTHRRHIGLVLFIMVTCIPIVHKTSKWTIHEATRTHKCDSIFEQASVQANEVERVQATKEPINPHADNWNVTLGEPKAPEKWIDLGEFRITFYCSCSKCCGKWSKYNRTRTGTTPAEGRTIAIDPRVIPLGSRVQIAGHEYKAEDTGSAIKGRHIDIYCSTHSGCYAAARKMGTSVEVELYKEDKND